MVQNYEDNIIAPALQFRDNYPIPAPRRRHIQPVPAPRTQISEKQRAFKGFKRSLKIGLNSNRDPLVQLQNTRLAISRLFGTLLSNTKCFKFPDHETMKITFIKRKDDANIYKTAYFNICRQLDYEQSLFFL